jgi:hypothetical protein
VVQRDGGDVWPAADHPAGAKIESGDGSNDDRRQYCFTAAISIKVDGSHEWGEGKGASLISKCGEHIPLLQGGLLIRHRRPLVLADGRNREYRSALTWRCACCTCYMNLNSRQPHRAVNRTRQYGGFSFASVSAGAPVSLCRPFAAVAQLHMPRPIAECP